MKKNESYTSEFIFNQSGIIINPKREGDYLLVAGIIPSSPAEEAGIIKGDKINIAKKIKMETIQIRRL